VAFLESDTLPKLKPIFDEGVSEIENSYIVGFILPQGNKMIDVSCFVTGVQYELYKSKCDEVMNTFSFTE